MSPVCRNGFQPNTAKQKHICIVTETYPPEINGVALTLARLVDGVLAQGHTVSVIRPHQRTSDCPGYICHLKVTLVRGLPLPGYRGLYVGLPATGLLRGCWTQHRPDVVYVATEGASGMVSGAHRPASGDSDIQWLSYQLPQLLQALSCGLVAVCGLRYLCRFHNRTIGTLVPSIDLCNRLQAIGFKNVSVLGRGVDSQLFTPERRCAVLRQQWRVADHDLVALYVGRLAPEKNLGLAIDAYRAMQQFRRSTKFVLVGDGPLCTTLQREHPDLIFCGVHTGEQLAKHYASADVFLFPSETETFGNVTLEAMASGLAVVAYNYAAARMHITHGETGVLVPYGKSQAFVDAAVKLAREPQSLHQIRRQAREYVASIDWQCVVERFVSLLTGALVQSHPVSNPAIS